MIDLTRITIRIGSKDPQYLNVDLGREEVGHFLLSRRRIVDQHSLERRHDYILDEVRRVIEPVLIAAELS